MEITDKTLNTLIEKLEWTLEAGDIQGKSEYYGYRLYVSNDITNNYNSFTMEIYKDGWPIDFDDYNLFNICQEKAAEMEIEQEEKWRQEQIFRETHWYL